VKRGRRTVEEACLEMSRCCTCGNYNLTRGMKLFKKLMAQYTVHTLY